MKSPLLSQFLVCGAAQLAAVSVGGAVIFPSVVLQQFTDGASGAPLDIDTASWIGSIHGVAGALSVALPWLMQWRGRRVAFVFACALSGAGWTTAHTAHSAALLLLAEALHGLANHSLLAVSLLTISEMVDPKFRTVLMMSFHLVQTFGMVLMSIMGRFMRYETIALAMCAPSVAALLMSLAWPESPAWLAWKGRFAECERAFGVLRGTDERATRELQELIAAQKEQLSMARRQQGSSLSRLCRTLRSRDFYVPCWYMFVLLFMMYWSGGLVMLIYAVQLMQRATDDADLASFGGVIMNSVMFCGVCLSAALVRRFEPKAVLLGSCGCTALALLGTAAASRLAPLGSPLAAWLLAVVTACSSVGVVPLVFPLAAELLPVARRAVGGAGYVLLVCALHSSSLKLAPYMLLHLRLWGALLVYAATLALCGAVVWKYVPETKGRTLPQIERYYHTGTFDETRQSGKETEMFVFENESYAANILTK